GLNELRGVSLPDPSSSPQYPTRVFQTVNRLASVLDEAKSDLDRAVHQESGVYEMLLFPDAVIYVREEAPMFIRVQYEFGVTAAVASANADRIPDDIERCCKMAGEP